MSGGPKPLSMADLCHDLGVTRRTVQRWLKHPDPPPSHRGPGKRGKLTFDLAEVKAWMMRIGYSGEKGSAGAPPPGHDAPQGEAPDTRGQSTGDLVRLTRLVALRIKQLEVKKRERIEAQARGDLLPRDDVDRFLAVLRSSVERRLDALPGKLAMTLVESTDYDAVYALLERELHEARGLLPQDILAELSLA